MSKVKFENLLGKYSLPYKKQSFESNIHIYKIENNKKINIVQMVEDTNIFRIDRDLFYYLNNQSIMYCFLLINKLDSSLFYLEFGAKNNWLKSSFERSDKDELYFGKIVLNHKISEAHLIEKIKNY